MDLLAAKTRGMDAYMNRHNLDAVLFPGSVGAMIAAKAGYPSVMVPGGFISGVDGKDNAHYPLCITFAGGAWSEQQAPVGQLNEQASNKRKRPWLARPLTQHCDRPRVRGTFGSDIVLARARCQCWLSEALNTAWAQRAAGSGPSSCGPAAQVLGLPASHCMRT